MRYLLLLLLFCCPFVICAQGGSGGLTALGNVIEDLLILCFFKIPIGIVVLINIRAFFRRKGKGVKLNVLGFILSLILIFFINLDPYLFKENTVWINVILITSSIHLFIAMNKLIFYQKK